MVRSGQMLLATALNYHLLGRGTVYAWLIFCFVLNVDFTEWRLATSDKKQRMLHRQVNYKTHTHTYTIVFI